LSRGVFGGGSLIGALNDPTLLEEANQSTNGSTTALTYLLDWGRVSLIGVSMGFLINSWAQGIDPSVGQVIGFTIRRLPLWAVTFVVAKLAVGFGLVAFVIPGLALGLSFTLVSPILAIEKTGPFTTLSRAFALMRVRPTQMLGLYAACAVVGGFVASALTAIPAFVALYFGTDVAWPLISMGSIVSSSLLAPFNGAAATLMYHDIRFRHEGLDLVRRADRVFPPVPEVARG
jgi:hypothetical protein